MNIMYKQDIINQLQTLQDKIPSGEIDFDKLINDAFVFSEIQDIATWCENNIYLPTTVGANPSNVNLNLTPYLRSILNSFADEDVREISIIKPAQCGATLLMLMLIFYIIDNEPANAMFVAANKGDAGEMSLERFLPIMTESENLKKHLITPNTNDITKNSYRLRNMILHFAWATSPTQLASKAKKYLFCDEVDKWKMNLKNEADPISLAMQRLKTYPDSKAVFASTPTHRFGVINERFENSNKSYYYCPCPNCNELLDMNFNNIKKPDEYKKATKDKILKDKPCYYECEHCKYHIKENEKDYWISTGVWKSSHPEVVNHHGYAISGIMSPFNSFSKIMYDFMEAIEDVTKEKLKNFFNSVMGDFFEENIKYSEINNTYIDIQLNKNTVPVNTAFLICGVDKQGDRRYYSVYSFNFGYTVNLVDYGVLENDDDLIVNIYDKVYNDINGKEYKIEYFGYDTGFQPYPIYDLNREYKNIIPVKGFSRSTVNRNYTFKELAEYPGVSLLSIATEFYKDIFYDTLISEKRIKLHNETDKEFIKQLNSEGKLFDKNNKNYKYGLKAGHKDNHYLDCAVYAIAVVDTLGYFRKQEYRDDYNVHIERMNTINNIRNSEMYKQKKELKQFKKELNRQDNEYIF